MHLELPKESVCAAAAGEFDKEIQSPTTTTI